MSLDRGTTGLSRRMVLAVAAAFGLSAVLTQRDAGSVLVAALSDAGAAARLGRSAGWPQQGGREALTKQLLADLAMTPRDAVRAAIPDIRRRIARRIASDFAAGRSVKIQGWVLSVTETRLCALAADGGGAA